MSTYAHLPDEMKKLAVELAVALANQRTSHDWRRARAVATQMCDLKAIMAITAEEWRDLGAAADVWLWVAASKKAGRQTPDKAERLVARLAGYQTGGGFHHRRAELRACEAELNAALASGRPLTPRLWVALGAAVVFYKAEKFQGSKGRTYSFQSRFGSCKHAPCGKFYFRTARGPEPPKWCSETCGRNAWKARRRAGRH
jgi:hypothetical protein